jgi:hypothetical protein
MTEAELQALCDDWQARLRLQDWDVRVCWGRKWNLAANRVADLTWQAHPKRALITILRPGDMEPDALEKYWPTNVDGDIENSVVHELLHLFWVPLHALMEGKYHEDVAMEQAINALAGCLVTLKRQAKPELTVGGLENALEDWQAAVAASPNPEKLKPLDPKRMVAAPMTRSSEPETTCAKCGGWHQDARGEQGRAEAPLPNGEYQCVGCGKRFNIYEAGLVTDAYGTWHSRCRPDPRREHVQEQNGPPHASSPAYCPHADCQDTQCVEFRALLERERTDRRESA